MDAFCAIYSAGLTRKTAGTLVRVGEDEIYENGVIFHEMIVNIYEDMAPEGERRFLIVFIFARLTRR